MHDRNYEKKADASFCSKKLAVTASNRSDRNVISVLLLVLNFLKLIISYTFYSGPFLAKFNHRSSLY